MLKLLLVVLFAACLAPIALGATITWTGNGGNSLWGYANNWQGGSIPTASDDVLINALGGSSVSISAPAQANKITIGGGTYTQTLIVLHQLTVGAGGITVNTGGVLQIQSNTALPLASSGYVNVNAGGILVFQSGLITGAGYYILAGATLLFSQNPLKVISATTLFNYGQTTIQSSTIQFSKSGSFANVGGNVTAIGGIQLIGIDATANSFSTEKGSFIFQGSSASQPLYFQVPTQFGTDLNIASGAVVIADDFKTNASISVPDGTSLTVNSGAFVASLSSIKGMGTLVIEGNTVVAGPSSLETLTVSDSGSLTFTAGATFTWAYFGGKVAVQSSTPLSITNLTIAGGTISGSGTTAISKNLQISKSDVGNADSFISSNVILYGTGSISAGVYLLFGAGGILHVAAAATLQVASATFAVQSGSPLVVVDGTITVTDSIQSGVVLQGQGVFKVNAGITTFSGNQFTIGSLIIASSAFVRFQTSVLTINSITGAGGINITAAPSPVSTIGPISVPTIGILSGVVNIVSFSTSNINLWNGNVKLDSGSSSTADTFNIFAGSLAGAAKIATDDLNLILVLPIQLSGVAIKTERFSIQSTGNGSIQTSNGATIVSGASGSSDPLVRAN